MKFGWALLLCAVFGLAGCARSAPQGGPITLTYASLYPPGHPFSLADQKWISFVEARSQGQIRIKPYWSGTLISSEENMTEIRHGVVDIGMITPMYARSAHLQRVQTSFYGDVESIADQIDLYKCLADRFPQLNSEMPGLHVLAVQGGNLPGLLTSRRAVHSLADLKGLRLRTQHDMANIVRAYGGDPVDMPMADVYSAMARGGIDGVIAPADAMVSMHLAEVGRDYTALRVPRGAYPARAMSDARWQALPPAARAVLAEGQTVWEAAFAQSITGAQAKGLDFAASKHVKLASLNHADQLRFEQLYNQQALQSARQLSAYGIAAEPIVRAGRQLAQQRHGALPLTCNPAATSHSQTAASAAGRVHPPA